MHINVETGDVLTFPADLLIVKYAQALHGVDRAVTEVLGLQFFMPPEMPRIGAHRMLVSDGKLGASQVLFIGVPPLRDFGYREIRDFARTALSVAGELTRSVRRLALTVHGPNLGLDELECFEALIAGLMDALLMGAFPPLLEQIYIIEREERRSVRLNAALDSLVTSRLLPIDDRGVLAPNQDPATRERIRAAGYASESKPFLFVAMPFQDEMKDNYDYGILTAARKAGLLCERVDETHFTGDVLTRVKSRIDSCRAVVADLSSANPNVYLEVGYAWGRNKPTILLVRDGDELKFDVQGQRCLKYRRIKDIEERLGEAIASLGLTALVS